jgi:HSP20 family molecular chaperone IbpA
VLLETGVDIYDTEKAIIINAELPGLSKDNITLMLKKIS